MWFQTYFGVDVDSIADPVRRSAMRTMIKTYGQTPKQLFKQPHPPATAGAKVTERAKHRKVGLEAVEMGHTQQEYVHSFT